MAEGVAVIFGKEGDRFLARTVILEGEGGSPVGIRTSPRRTRKDPTMLSAILRFFRTDSSSSRKAARPRTRPSVEALEQLDLLATGGFSPAIQISVLPNAGVSIFQRSTAPVVIQVDTGSDATSMPDDPTPAEAPAPQSGSSDTMGLVSFGYRGRGHGSRWGWGARGRRRHGGYRPGHYWHY